mgnify:CR=1 FL=1
MALALLLKTDQFRLATDRCVLKRDEVVAMENTIDMLHAAVAEADRIRQDAEQKSKALLEKARLRGESLVRDEVARAAMAAHVNAGRVLRNVEPVLVDILVDTITRMAAGLDRRQVIEQSMAEISRAIGQQTFAVLKVAPEDLALATQTVEDLTRQARLPATLSVRADPSLAAADCVLVTDNGKLTIGLSQQLKALAQTVRAALVNIQVEDDLPSSAPATADEAASSRHE